MSSPAQTADDEARDPDPPPPKLTRILALARPERGVLTLAAFFVLLGSAAGLAYPKILGEGIDRFAGDEAPGLAGFAIAIAVITVQGGSIGLRYFLFATAGERIVARLRRDLFGSLLRQEIAFFDGRRTGEMLSRLMADTTSVQQAVTLEVSMLARDLLMAFGALALMANVSIALTLTTLGIVPPIAIGAVWVGRKVERYGKKVQDSLAAANTTAEEAIGGVRTVRSFAQEERETTQYGDAVWTTYELARTRTKYVAMFIAVSFIASFSAIVVVLGLGLEQVGDGTMTGGALSAYVLWGITAAFAIAGLAERFTTFAAARGAAARVFALLDREPTIPVAGGVAPDRCEGRVALRDIRFRYPSREDVVVLDGVDLDLSPGRVVALVGPSGSGKSTIAALLMRFYDAEKGSITLDDRDYTSLDPTWLRTVVGAVPQDPMLFSTSIRENIRYGRLDATDAEVASAAAAAHVSEFADGLPDRLDTQVGERGVQLSGGQKQRVAIARAILRNPRVLLLDEATSALDAESEALVKDALDGLMAERASLVIAHRLSTVRDADEVVVLEGGRVVQRGTHDELVASEGLYSRLVRRQFAAVG